MPHSPLPPALLRDLTAVVGPRHVLTGDATAGYAVDWTGRFRGDPPAVLRPRDTEQVAALLQLCSGAGIPVVPQGGNTGLVGGSVPVHGEVVLSLSRLDRLGPADLEAAQVTAGAGVTLSQAAAAAPGLDLGVLIASRDSATVGGAVATNAGGLRVLRYGPMRAQVRGIEAVLADGTVLSHLSGLVKDNTGYDYPSLLAGSEGTLAVITAARLRLVPRARRPVTVLCGLPSLGELHAVARLAADRVPGLLSAEFFTPAGLDVLAGHAGLAPPLADPARRISCWRRTARAPWTIWPPWRGLSRRRGAGGGGPGPAVGLPGTPAGGGGLPRRPPQAGRLRARGALGRTGGRGGRRRGRGGPGRHGHHLRSRRGRKRARQHRPGGAADGRHEDAVFSFVASLGGSISAEHGIGTLKARWLPLVRSAAERDLFARIRRRLDPAGILNPHVLPR